DAVLDAGPVRVVDQGDLRVRVRGELAVVVPGGHPVHRVLAIALDPLLELPVVEQARFAEQEGGDLVDGDRRDCGCGHGQAFRVLGWVRVPALRRGRPGPGPPGGLPPPPPRRPRRPGPGASSRASSRAAPGTAPRPRSWRRRRARCSYRAR